jgi:hypothetical protein
MKFNNPELQRVYEEGEPIIKSHLEFLDGINNDIKILEGLLKTTGLSLLQTHCFYDDLELFFLDGRVICKTENVSKPLLECSVRTRLKAAPHLDKFFKYCMDNLGVCK